MTQPNAFQDPFEFLRSMWTSVPVPGMVAPLLDPSEIDKRISDLKSVENWLSMNLSMLRMSIQGLEMQKATVGAFKTMQESQGAAQQQFAEAATAATAAASNAATSAAEAWWSLLQAGQGGAPKTEGSSDSEPAAPPPSGRK
jgi:hypothetical protein